MVQPDELPPTGGLHPACHTGSMRDVLRIAWPLILASSGHALRLFSDRAMLSRHSDVAIKASFQAGVTSFTLMCFFLGICFYTATFVSQYIGSNQPRRVGPSVWTGIHFALAGGAILPLLLPFSGVIIGLFGHDGPLLAAELSYFRILLAGSVFGLLNGALAGFWSGRGKTRVVMAVELGMTVANIALNYVLIFGYTPWGTLSPFGEMGIAGAAWGTVISAALGTAAYAILLLRPKHRVKFATNHWRPDRELLGRLWTFGSPSGLRFFLELLSFNVFAYLLGKLASAEREASNVALSVNALAFLPLIGIGNATSVLVGQSIGAKDIPSARRGVKNAIRMGVIYAIFATAVFVIFPDALLQIFRRDGDESQVQVFKIARVLLLFLAGYITFDAVAIIFSHALSGAGDTKWTMYMNVGLSWGAFALPAILADRLGGGLYSLWAILLAYIAIIAVIFALRFRQGKWEKMSVIGSRPTPTADPIDFET